MESPRADWCRSCGRPIYWTVNDATGRPMPADAVPVKNGNVLLSMVVARERTVPQGDTGQVIRVAAGVVLSHVIGKDEKVKEGRNRYVSHFATCSQSGDWRGKKR